MACAVCRGEHLPITKREGSARGAPAACPYAGLAFPELRAGHDRLFFGRWRGNDASPIDVRRSFRQMDDYLRMLDIALKPFDQPAARRDLSKAFAAYFSSDPEDGGPGALLSLDHALSYAHRVLNDLLQETGLPSHSPMDFAEWYDAGEIPFREEW
jgi:hypothetical protein